MIASLEISSGDTKGQSVASLNERDFRAIAAIALEAAGLHIPETKRALVQSRVTKRMRVLGTSDFAEYLAIVSRKENTQERRELISVLTTNVSSFFRENHHFDYLRQHVVPEIEAKIRRGQPVRIWSAGCSSGQEALSIAMVCARRFERLHEKDFLILATDIDAAILRRAEAGCYTDAEMVGVSDEDRRTFFTPNPAGCGFQTKADIRALIRCRELNLHGRWPMRRPFDAIFCRNVVIYFDEEHQRQLWPRFHSALLPQGTFFLGHSERIHSPESIGFANAGVTIYRKI